MAESVVQLAYDTACATLREQDGSLANLRNRATGIFAAAAVGTSFATASGLLNTNPQRPHVFPVWAAFSMLGLVFLLGVCIMAVPAPPSPSEPQPAPDQPG